jgi:hypothetical protein
MAVYPRRVLGRLHLQYFLEARLPEHFANGLLQFGRLYVYEDRPWTIIFAKGTSNQEGVVCSLANIFRLAIHLG